MGTIVPMIAEGIKFCMEKSTTYVSNYYCKYEKSLNKVNNKCIESAKNTANMEIYEKTRHNFLPILAICKYLNNNCNKFIDSEFLLNGDMKDVASYVNHISHLPNNIFAQYIQFH
jgi:gamma-glutamyl-gamma-aminobutyrate hydrolase PuuD